MPVSSQLRGVLSMLAAVATFAIMDVAMKTLAHSYPAMQVTFLRGAASLPFLLGATLFFSSIHDLVPRRWGVHLLRGVLSLVTLFFFVKAVSLLSLSDAYAIFMSAPLLITALSVPLLGEHVGWRRWLAVTAGMIGVIIILKPEGKDLVTLGGLAAVASASGYALSALTIRISTRTETNAATVIWPLALMATVSGIVAAPAWVELQPEHWSWIAALGIFGALGQYFITEAFRYAAPPVVAPLEYSALAWGMFYDWLLWSTIPNARMLTGASIIVLSGLYVIHRERMSGGTKKEAEWAGS